MLTAPPDTFDPQAEAELHYLQCDTSLTEFSNKLSEAIAVEDINKLALLLRRGDATQVRDELWRLFDAYWSRQIANDLRKQRLDYERNKA